MDMQYIISQEKVIEYYIKYVDHILNHWEMFIKQVCIA